jgi:hypothetical protein
VAGFDAARPQRVDLLGYFWSKSGNEATSDRGGDVKDAIRNAPAVLLGRLHPSLQMKEKEKPP